MRGEPKACFRFLDQSDITYTRLDDSPKGQECGFYNALTLDRSLLPYSTPLQMTCPLTGALAVWERQSLVLNVKTHFESPAARVLSFGSYNCRRLYGRSTGRFSEHAKGNAIDIKGFELADGRRILVLDHWGKKTPEGRFLKAVHHDACRVFGTVLGPDYNAAHADHFHFDMSQTGICK